MVNGTVVIVQWLSLTDKCFAQTRLGYSIPANASPRRIERHSKRTWLRSLSKYQIVQEKRRGSVSATGATPYSNVTDSFGDVARLAFYVEELPIGGVLS